MRELKINEIKVVSGGEFTNLEILFGSGFAGSLVGAGLGAYINSNVVTGSYSLLVNVFASGFGIVAGAPIGCLIGISLGGIYNYLSS